MHDDFWLHVFDVSYLWVFYMQGHDLEKTGKFKVQSKVGGIEDEKTKWERKSAWRIIGSQWPATARRLIGPVLKVALTT